MKKAFRFLPRVSAALSALTLAFLLVDLLWPKLSLFLNEWIKVILLALCAVSSACSLMLLIRYREEIRRESWL